MGTAIKHPVLDQVKPSHVIFDIRALCHECLCKDYRGTLFVKAAAPN